MATVRTYLNFKGPIHRIGDLPPDPEKPRSAGGKVIMPLADMFWGAYFSHNKA